MSLSEAFPGSLAAPADLPGHRAATTLPPSAAPPVNTFQYTAAKTDVASAHLWGNGSHRRVLRSHELGWIGYRFVLCSSGGGGGGYSSSSCNNMVLSSVDEASPALLFSA